MLQTYLISNRSDCTSELSEMVPFRMIQNISDLSDVKSIRQDKTCLKFALQTTSDPISNGPDQTISDQPDFSRLQTTSERPSFS